MTQIQPESSLKQKAAANGYLLIQTLMWGLSFIITKNVTAAMPASAFLALRFILAVLVLLPFYIRKLRNAMSPAFCKAALLLGGLVFISTALQTYGLAHTSVTNSSFITSTTVLLVPIFERVIFKKKLPRALWLGCIAAFAGVTVLAGSVSLSFNLGDLMTALCAVGFSLQILYAAKYAVQFPADTIGVAQLIAAALMFTALWGVDAFSLTGFEAGFIGPLLFMSIINTSVGFVGQFVAYRYTDAAVASLIFSLEPIFATAFAMIIPDANGCCETLTFKTGIGGLLVLAGVAVAMWDAFRPKNTAGIREAISETAE